MKHSYIPPAQSERKRRPVTAAILIMDPSVFSLDTSGQWLSSMITENGKAVLILTIWGKDGSIQKKGTLEKIP